MVVACPEPVEVGVEAFIPSTFFQTKKINGITISQKKRLNLQYGQQI